MRSVLVILAALGSWLTMSASASAAPVKGSDAATIHALEEEWESALLTGNHRALERILAPEFKLMGPGRRGPGFTPRAEWFANVKNMKLDQYNTEVLDVIIAGNTAIATVEGNWKVSFAGQSSRESRFVLSDTWVKRNGRWSVVFRHATTLPNDSSPAASR
jgi:hypothetical protein